MSFGGNSIYQFTNAVFDLEVGRASNENPHNLSQNIVGDRYDWNAIRKFTLRWTQNDSVLLFIMDSPVSEREGRVVACTTCATGDEWVIDLVSATNDRYLYQIGLARDPTLVWALNVSTVPGNQVHLEPRDPNNPRQFWALRQVPP